MSFKKISELARSLNVVLGDRDQVAALIQTIPNDKLDDSLLVTDCLEVSGSIDVISSKKAANLLGQEKKLVLADMLESINVDALAAVTGLIKGGGCLILLLQRRHDWDKVYHSYFSKRFIQQLTESDLVCFIEADDTEKLNHLLSSLSQLVIETEIELTSDQGEVVKKITELSQPDNSQANSRQSLVIISDRGRGKSTSLGIVAAELMAARPIKILMTAPRFKACEIAFTHAQKRLPGTKIRQASIKHQQSEFRFMAPDEILRSEVQADLLFIDEAASIPLPILSQLHQRFNRTVFVSTVHGYEGTGRGFSVRFSAELDRVSPGWKKLEMKTPVRWSVDDQLESWLFKCLCLDAEIADVALPINLAEISIRQLNQAELFENETLLRQVFALLVLAHYKTRPSDLQRMMDDDVVITVAEQQNSIIGVILSADEGGFEEAISEAVYRGERRIQGHLLAQTLTYHCGIKHASCAQSHRIMRIVVHPLYQHKGVGSLLLKQLKDTLTHRQTDVLGASFGLTDELANFWQQNDFQITRIGLKKEQSSGERAAVYVYPMTDTGANIVSQSRDRFARQFPKLHESELSDVSATGLALPQADVVTEMTGDDIEDVFSFVNYSRDYELCIAGLNKWLKINHEMIQQDASHKNYNEIIKRIVDERANWKDVAILMGLDGKKQARQLFKQAVRYFWQKLNQ